MTEIPTESKVYETYPEPKSKWKVALTVLWYLFLVVMVIGMLISTAIYCYDRGKNSEGLLADYYTVKKACLSEGMAVLAQEEKLSSDVDGRVYFVCVQK